MSNTNPPIIGLEKEIEDPGSGALVRFHVVRAYSVAMIADGSCSVTFASFVSSAAYDAGKNPLAHITIPLTGLPAGDVDRLPTWFADRVLTDEVANALSGAVAVYAPASGESAA